MWPEGNGSALILTTSYRPGDWSGTISRAASIASASPVMSPRLKRNIIGPIEHRCRAWMPALTSADTPGTATKYTAPPTEKGIVFGLAPEWPVVAAARQLDLRAGGVLGRCGHADPSDALRRHRHGQT